MHTVSWTSMNYRAVMKHKMYSYIVPGGAHAAQSSLEINKRKLIHNRIYVM